MGRSGFRLPGLPTAQSGLRHPAEPAACRRIIVCKKGASAPLFYEILFPPRGRYAASFSSAVLSALPIYISFTSASPISLFKYC